MAYTRAMPALREIDRAARRMLGWRVALAPASFDRPGLARALARVVPHARRFHAAVLDARLDGETLHVAVTSRDGGLVAPLALDAGPGRSAIAVRWHPRGALPRVSVGAAMDTPAALLRAAVVDLAARVDEACADLDPEGVHQLRVMIRRAKVVRRSIGAAGDTAFAALDAVLLAIAEPAAAVRNGDVARETLQGIGLTATEARALDAQLAARRETSVAALRAACGDAKARAGLVDAQRAAAALSVGTAEEVFRARYARDLRGLRRALGRVSDLESLHDVRRRARRLRDLLDLTARALGPGRRALRGALQRVIHPLGRVNDLATLRAELERDAAPSAHVRAALGGAMHEAMAAALGPLLALDREVEALRGYARR